MTRAWARAAALGAVLTALAGCGRDAGAPVRPDPPPPPLVVRVEPAPRSQQVATDTPIWAEFGEPLDPASVTVTNVFLLVDARRVPITVSWDAATRRLHVIPDAPLDLRRTHTVEFSEGLRTAAGSRLTGGWYWQFKTISVRIPQSPLPMHGTTGESPFTLLRWEGITESQAGPVEYRLRVTADSASAGDSGTQPLAVLASGGRYMPRVRWPQDHPVWWSVEAFNLETGESRTGQTWRFECMPADAPTDTVELLLQEHVWYDATRDRVTCMGDSVVTGNLWNGVIRWAYPGLDSTRRLAGALIELTPYAHWQDFIQIGASVWMAEGPWPFCSISLPGPPDVPADGKLADVEILRPGRVRFASDPLTAHLEAMGRVGGYHGYVFRSAHRIAYLPPAAGRARCAVVVYRSPAATVAAQPTAPHAQRAVSRVAPAANRRSTARRR